MELLRWKKLHAIRPTVGDYKQKTYLSRRDAVLLNRLHIGHTRLTHSFLLLGDDLPRVLTTLENMEISGNLLILENSGKTQGI